MGRIGTLVCVAVVVLVAMVAGSRVGAVSVADLEQAKALWMANQLVASAPPTTPDCCTPDQWETWAWEVNQIGSILHRIHYDAINKLVRWDRYGNLEKPGVYDVLILFTNYTTQPFRKEWLYRPDNNTCDLYGADEFNPWCFGSTSGQVPAGTATISESQNNVWMQPVNNFYWTSTADTCLPVVVALDNDQTLFFNTTLGIADPSVFVIPQICANEGFDAITAADVPKADKKRFLAAFY